MVKMRLLKNKIDLNLLKELGNILLKLLMERNFMNVYCVLNCLKLELKEKFIIECIEKL